MIQAEALTKVYGSLKAVDNLSFKINAGEIVGLLGPNGAGKTTTMRLLTGFMPPTAGSIRIAEQDLRTAPLAAKRQLAYLPEQPPLYPELTVRESLEFVARLHGLERAKRKGVISEALEKTGIVEVRERLTGNLSRGFRQRVGLAQVLVTQARILILDEPTTGLDPQQIYDIRKLIAGLAGDHTIILSSHILQEVSALCQRVMIIDHGHLIENNWAPQQIGVEHTTLEEVYLRLTGVQPLEDAV